MEFRILGPLEVRDGDAAVQLGGARQRALLSLLLLEANQIVSVDRLVEALWPGLPPERATHTVHVHVSNVRKALGALAAGAASRLETRAPGYVLHTEPGELDLDRFETACARARGSLAAGDPEHAAALLHEALGLWHGAPLADVAYEAFAQPAIGRLEELRLTVLEDRIGADLLCGRHAVLVPELHALVAAHPLREGLRGHLMLALYRSGRQAEALEAFQDARSQLVEQLGIDPSPALQRLERAILRQEPELELVVPVPQPELRPDVQPVAQPTPQGAGAADATRAILLAAGEPERVGSLTAVLAPLARGERACDVILTRLLPAGAELAPWSALLNEHRVSLAARGVQARTAAFTSADPGRDLTRLAAEQQVDLVVLDAGAALTDGGLTEETRTILTEASCDVALLFPRAGDADESSPVLVAFGGSEHDWAALELGAWLAGARGATLRLLGTEGDESGDRRDASRLLANAALAVQQLAGVPTEPVLAARGAAGIVGAAAEAALLVAGLPEGWRQDGVAGARLEAAHHSPPPALLVRRGPRPGGLAPRENLTRYTWSLSLAGDAARQIASA